MEARTENDSTTPHSRKAQAKATTDTVNAKLPSKVLDVVADHRCFPNRLPTTDAYE